MNGWEECKGFLLGFADSHTIPKDIFRTGHVHTSFSWVFRKFPCVLVAGSFSVHLFLGMDVWAVSRSGLLQCPCQDPCIHVSWDIPAGFWVLSYLAVGCRGHEVYGCSASGDSATLVQDGYGVTNILLHSQSPTAPLETLHCLSPLRSPAEPCCSPAVPLAHVAGTLEVPGPLPHHVAAWASWQHGSLLAVRLPRSESGSCQVSLK